MKLKEGVTFIFPHPADGQAVAPKTYAFQPIPKRCGGYYLGGKRGMGFLLERKPSWWHRFWLRVTLGWEWHDER